LVGSHFVSSLTRLVSSAAMRTTRVCFLAFLLAFAIHEVSAQDDVPEVPDLNRPVPDVPDPGPDKDFVPVPDEEHGEHEGTGDEEEPAEDGDLEHEEEAEFSVLDIYQLHGRVDADKNGKITREELLAYFHKAHKEGAPADLALEEMQRIDANKDGSVSLTEIQDAHHSLEPDQDPDDVHEQNVHRDKLKFMAADADEDGELNFDEFFTYHHPDERVIAVEAKLRLEEIDKDKDGKLSYQEFAADVATDLATGVATDLATDVATDIATDVATDENISNVEDHRADKGVEVDARFKFLDADGSGFISLEEFIPWELGHFDRHEAINTLMGTADTNFDNELEVEELMAIEKDTFNHEAEHHAIRELIEFSKMEDEEETAEKQHDKGKDEL